MEPWIDHDEGVRVIPHPDGSFTYEPLKPETPPIMPTPAEVRAAREAASLTQTQAAALVHCKLRAWQQWEAGERKMHPAMWELFNLKRA